MSDYEYFGLAPGVSSEPHYRDRYPGESIMRRSADGARRQIRRTRARIHAETLKERVAAQFAQLNRAGIVLDLSRYGFATANGIFK